jgi:hypothetical protein
MANGRSVPCFSSHTILVSLKHLPFSAMERATYITKSFLIAFALVHKRLTAEQAALAAQVEVSSQIERWGEVEDCTDIFSSQKVVLTVFVQLMTLTIMMSDSTLVVPPVSWLIFNNHAATPQSNHNGPEYGHISSLVCKCCEQTMCPPSLVAVSISRQ